MSLQAKLGSFICLGLGMVVICLTATDYATRITAASNSRQTSGEKSAAALQGPQGDKLVDETRKNIQVLKGLPEPQLFPLMNFVASSLGVKCGFCHVQRG